MHFWILLWWMTLTFNHLSKVQVGTNGISFEYICDISEDWYLLRFAFKIIGIRIWDDCSILHMCLNMNWILWNILKWMLDSVRGSLEFYRFHRTFNEEVYHMMWFTFRLNFDLILTLEYFPASLIQELMPKDWWNPFQQSQSVND